MTRWLRRWWTGSTRTSSASTSRSRLNLESMEAREVPAALAGNGIALPLYGPGMDTAVEVINPATNAVLYRSFPGFRGPIVAAAGDVNGDGIADAIVGVQNANGLVAVFDGTSGGLLGAAKVFPGNAGPINVGVADLNGDGYAEILVTAGSPGAPVRAFDVHDGLSAGFNAYPGLSAPTSVTGADLDGDGCDEILVGAAGRVGAFTALGGPLIPAVPVFPGFNGSISLAAGDVNGDGRDDIVFGAGPGSPGVEVKVIDGVTGVVLADFVPFSHSVTTGVNVFVADGNGDGVGDVFASPQGGSPALVGFNVQTGSFFPAAYGGFGVPADNGDSGNYGGDSGYYYDPSSYPTSSYTPPDTSYYPSTDYSTPDYSASDYSSGSDSWSDCGCDYTGDTGDYSDPTS